MSGGVVLRGLASASAGGPRRSFHRDSRETTRTKRQSADTYYDESKPGREGHFFTRATRWLTRARPAGPVG